jgi:hypothetical protein
MKRFRVLSFSAFVVFVRVLIGRSDHDIEIASSIEVVFEPKDLSWILNLFAWVPFCWNLHFEPISIVWQEVCVRLWLPKHVCSFTVGGISRRYFGTNSSGADEESESKTAGDGGVIVFMRLLSFTDDLNRFGERHVTLG